MSKNVNSARRQTDFALAALMEIPSQYQATLELGLLGYALTLHIWDSSAFFVDLRMLFLISSWWSSRRRGSSPERVPLPPPLYGAAPSNGYPRTPRSNSFQTRTPSHGRYNQGVGTTPSTSSYYDNQVSNLFGASYSFIWTTLNFMFHFHHFKLLFGSLLVRISVLWL